MPGRTYTLREACDELGVQLNTLHKWMDRDGITPEPDPVDFRKKVLTEEQVEELARTHRREVSGGTDALVRVVGELRERVELLERRVRELEHARDRG